MGDLLIQKADFLRGVEGQVKRVKDEFQRMQSLLNDAVNEKAKDERIRNWISQLRQDVIETFISRVDSTPWSRGLLRTFAPLPNHVYHLNRFGKETRSIRSRVCRKKGERYNLDYKGMQSSRRSKDVGWQHKLAAWYEDEDEDEDEVGLEEDVEMLLQKAILEEKRGLSIASIVGMAGIGKTTLARKLYNHDAIAGRFDCRAWVCVSSEFRRKEVIKVLIRQLQDLITEDKLNVLLENMDQLDEQSLQHVLYQFLRGRRYFIVLDDVWEHADWESLASAFPDEDKGSRLLLTSRNRDVTRHAQYVHEMKTLDPSKSWQLFTEMVFFDDNDKKCPEHLENIGREILKKCNGLPLAIKEIGMQLAMKRPIKSEWEEVLKKMDLSVMSAVLELSYHKLPAKLKLCFLCLGFFKEGAIIRAEKLIQIWIAGGMVRHGRGKNETVEEIARSYLDKLIDRNMVQVKDMTKDYRVKNCHINNILHRLSITKAKAEISSEGLRKDSFRPFDRPHHGAIYCNRKRFICSVNQDKDLHSLFFHGGGNFNGSPFFWKSFKLLKVLDFEDFGLKKLPDTIGALTRLRYLGLRNNYIQELPHTLGRLKKLEVLDIALNFMVELPNVIWKMDSLRHLYMSDIVCKTPLKIEALKNLQTLTYISVDNWTYDLSGLQKMTSLRKLGIEELDGHSDVSKLFTSLANLENLVCLTLRGFRFKRMPSLDEVGILHRLTQLKLDGLLTMLPSFPPNLSYLTLVDTSLDKDPMPVLEKLPKLSYLKLRNAYTGDKVVISRYGFPKLQVLCIGESWHLRNVEVEKGAMPKLKRLEINNCPYMESLTEEVGLMTNLEDLKMVRVQI